jgi:hypothetical protein
MAFEIEYFHKRVLAEIEAWPAKTPDRELKIARKRAKELQRWLS